MTALYRAVQFNPQCTVCSLSTRQAVSGQSERPIKDVILVAISAYPGKREEATKMSLAPGTNNEDTSGAGAFLRRCLYWAIECDPTWDGPPINELVYFTNAIKCSPRDKTVKDIHRSRCRDTWLLPELTALPTGVPLLLAGSEAVKAIHGLDATIANYRGAVYNWRGHPTVTTFNPIEVERGVFYKTTIDEEDVKRDLKALLHSKKTLRDSDIDKIVKTRMWNPVPVGSMMWYFRKDINIIKREILNYANTK